MAAFTTTKGSGLPGQQTLTVQELIEWLEGVRAELGPNTLVVVRDADTAWPMGVELDQNGHEDVVESNIQITTDYYR